jgi:hypothetical protein
MLEALTKIGPDDNVNVAMAGIEKMHIRSNIRIIVLIPWIYVARDSLRVTAKLRVITPCCYLACGTGIGAWRTAATAARPPELESKQINKTGNLPRTGRGRRVT